MEEKKEEKESVLKRMGRGFKVMYEKLCNSNYVQSIQEENKLGEEGKLDDMMPKGIGEVQQEDVFSTDLSKLGKTDL